MRSRLPHRAIPIPGPPSPSSAECPDADRNTNGPPDGSNGGGDGLGARSRARQTGGPRRDGVQSARMGDGGSRRSGMSSRILPAPSGSGAVKAGRARSPDRGGDHACSSISIGRRFPEHARARGPRRPPDGQAAGRRWSPEPSRGHGVICRPRPGAGIGHRPPGPLRGDRISHPAMIGRPRGSSGPRQRVMNASEPNGFSAASAPRSHTFPRRQVANSPTTQSSPIVPLNSPLSSAPSPKMVTSRI